MFAEEEMERWEQSETRLRSALEDFIKAAQATYQGQLFAHDALEGLRLMDLVRKNIRYRCYESTFRGFECGGQKRPC